MHARDGQSAAAVLLGATGLAFAGWALLDLERFALVGVLCAMAFPAALARPGGANVAAADVLLVIALAAWLARHALGAAPPPLIRGNPLLLPTALFAAYSIASLVWSTDAHATVKTALQMVEIVVLTPLVYASLPSSLGRIRRALHVYLGVSSAIAVAAAFAWVASGASKATYLPGLHKNAASGFVAVGLVIAFAFVLDSKVSRPGRRMLLLVCALDIAGLVATYSRGAIAGALVAMAVVSVMLRRARTLTVVLGIAATAAIAVSVATSLTIPTNPGGGFKSSAVRLLSYRDGVRAIERHPLLGTGAGTYWDAIPELKIGLPDPNNIFLLTWAELGVGGLLVLLFLLRRFWRVLRYAQRLSSDARVLAIAVGAAAIAMLVHFQFDVTWNRGSATICFAMLGLLVAVARLDLRRQPATAGIARRGWTGAAPRAAVTRRLRVLHVVSSSGFHGIERHVVDLSVGLRKLDCDVAIACPPAAKRLRREAEAAGVELVPPTAARGTLATAALASAARRRPDVVHVHDGFAAAIGWRVATASRARLIRTQHFVEPASTHRSGWRRNASLAVHRAINADASAVIAVSASVAEAVRERREAGRNDPVVIAPGIVIPGDEQVDALVAARRSANVPMLATVGRLEAEKSHRLLLHAFSRTRTRLPDLRLLVVGTGSLAEELQELARALGVGDAIEWTGSLDDPWSRAAEAHVYVHPAAYEPHGLATAEAMARSLPVIGIRAGGTAELVTDGETGLLVEADDAAALADAIVRLVEDRALAERLGAAGRQRARADLGIEHTARRTFGVYRRAR